MGAPLEDNFDDYKPKTEAANPTIAATPAEPARPADPTTVSTTGTSAAALVAPVANGPT